MLARLDAGLKVEIEDGTLDNDDMADKDRERAEEMDVPIATSPEVRNSALESCSLPTVSCVVISDMLLPDVLKTALSSAVGRRCSGTIARGARVGDGTRPRGAVPVGGGIGSRVGGESMGDDRAVEAEGGGERPGPAIEAEGGGDGLTIVAEERACFEGPASEPPGTRWSTNGADLLGVAQVSGCSRIVHSHAPFSCCVIEGSPCILV